MLYAYDQYKQQARERQQQAERERRAREAQRKEETHNVKRDKV